MIPTKAMIFAAGLGSRFKPVTDTIPKPLVKVKNKPLIDYNIETILVAGITDITINSFYLAEKLEDYLHKNYKTKNLNIIRENERLETGGGLLNACSYLGFNPVFTYNSDIIYPEFKQKNPLKLLLKNWDNKKHDALLVLCKKEDFLGYEGTGDYSFNQNGQIEKRENNDFIYTGCQIINTAILQNTQKKFFSLSEIFNQLLEKNRLGTIIYDEKVLHIGDINGLKIAENLL